MALLLWWNIKLGFKVENQPLRYIFGYRIQLENLEFFIESIFLGFWLSNSAILKVHEILNIVFGEFLCFTWAKITEIRNSEPSKLSKWQIFRPEVTEISANEYNEGRCIKSRINYFCLWHQIMFLAFLVKATWGIYLCSRIRLTSKA